MDKYQEMRVFTAVVDAGSFVAAAGALGMQLGGAAAPGVTPDRSKTFTDGSSADATQAQGSTPGLSPQLGHLQSVVGLVWRSVVLWMLLLALLSLANVVG